jgi:hypothetical protein
MVTAAGWSQSGGRMTRGRMKLRVRGARASGADGDRTRSLRGKAIESNGAQVQQLRAERRAERQLTFWRRVAVGGGVLALVAGVMIGRALPRGDEAPDQVAATSTADAPASSACLGAVKLANITISHGVLINRALADQNRVMEGLLAGTIEVDKAAELSKGALDVGAEQSPQFDEAQADFLSIVDRCQS